MSCDPPVGGSIQSHSPKAALIGINRVSGFPKGARILARRQSSQFGAERIDAALGTPRRIPFTDWLIFSSGNLVIFAGRTFNI
jgi:hypothetical protein